MDKIIEITLIDGSTGYGLRLEDGYVLECTVGRTLAETERLVRAMGWGAHDREHGGNEGERAVEAVAKVGGFSR